MTGTMAAAELRDPYALTLAEGARLLAGHPFHSVVVMGDSVAAGVREPTPGYLDLSAADRLLEVLAAGRPELSFANLGRTGATIAEVAATQLDAALGRRPDLVVLSAGGNDAFDGGFDPGRATTELSDLVAPLTDAGARVVLVGLFDLGGSGLLPPEIGRRMSAAFATLDEVMYRVADAVPGCVVNENRSHPLSRDPSIFAGDLIHCNARGHAVAAATLVRDIRRIADEMGGQTGSQARSRANSSRC